MQKWKLAGSTAAIALLSATGAWADVTPEDIWQNWQDMSASYGQTVTTDSAARDGDTLVVTGLKLSTDDGTNKMDSTIGEVRFKDKGDGTVEVTMSDTYTMALTTEGGEEFSPAKMDVTISQPGTIALASGTPEETSYAFTSPNATVTMKGMEGADDAASTFEMVANLTNFTGRYLVAGSADAKSLDSELALDNLTLTVDGTDAGGSSKVKITADVADIAGKGMGKAVGIDMADLAAALKAGMSVDASLTHGAVTFSVDVDENNAPSKLTGAAASGNFGLAMDASRLKYTSGGKGLALTVSGAEIPFPEVKIAYEEAAFDFMMPVSKSDTPSDFSFLTKIVGLTVSDEIWAMLDPGASLPRDPATLIIDTKGTAKMTADMMNEAEMAALGDAPPGDLLSLDVTELKASIAGADLTGSGAFTFDNTDLETYGGMPAPTGKIDLKLVGGNGLLDKLVALGMLSDDDAMGARMMMSMFANPGAGPDELTSSLEFKDKGFYANGQKLQ